MTGIDGEAIAEKARLIALLKGSVEYGGAYYATLTDRDSAATVTMTGTDGTNRTAVVSNGVVFTIAHVNEHYGNMITYLRAKGLVPPRTPPQAGWRNAVAPPRKRRD